ncbi:MAG: TetR/AcrR family transcriptional regulator [Betaproteobacteria bacterium]
MSTSIRKKASYHHGDLQAALVRTAGQMLEKEGVEALKLREVARRAGVSHNAPYRHFPQREALLAALAAEGFEWLGAAQRKATETGGLRAMGEAYVQFALAHPQRFRLMFGGRIPLARHAHLREVASRTFDGLSGALAARVPEAQGAQNASVAAWSLVHGLALLLMGDRIALGGRKREEFVRDVLASIRFVVGPAQPPA